MASKEAFVRFVCDQMNGAGEITYRKMFGDYGVYCDGKIFGLICDNQLYVKMTQAGARLCPDLPQAPPYEGAKPHYLVEDVDNAALLVDLVRATCGKLPPPKKRKTSRGQ